MATSPLTAKIASFSYSHPVSGAVVVHDLAIPLYEIDPIDARERHDWFASDKTNREITLVGEADVFDIVATIRLDNEPTELKAMLRLALQNDLTLTYAQGSDEYSLRVVRVIGADRDDTPIGRDRDRHGYGEWEVRVHFRSATAINSLFGGT